MMKDIYWSCVAFVENSCWQELFLDAGGVVCFEGLKKGCNLTTIKLMRYRTMVYGIRTCTCIGIHTYAHTHIHRYVRTCVTCVQKYTTRQQYTYLTDLLMYRIWCLAHDIWYIRFYMDVSLNGGTPKHPKMIIFSRKTHGCWVPPFQETPIYIYIYVYTGIF